MTTGMTKAGMTKSGIARAASCTAIAGATLLLFGCTAGCGASNDAAATESVGDTGEELDKTPGDGFISICDRDHRGTDDPIVFPGAPGLSHRHDFYGNKTTD